MRLLRKEGEVSEDRRSSERVFAFVPAVCSASLGGEGCKRPVRDKLHPTELSIWILRLSDGSLGSASHVAESPLCCN